MTGLEAEAFDWSAVTWVAVDWGTSNLRVWLMGAGDTVLDERSSGQGMGRLQPHQFEAALCEALGDFGDRHLPVIICGMAGARQGWQEAPYEAVPWMPKGVQGVAVATSSPRLSVTILPGLSQHTPPDVMRGEETQIAGFLAQEPDFSGVLCLPGTHTKWVKVEGGRIVHFRTVMTGEIFALLSGQSVLRHSVGAGTDWDDAEFDHCVGQSADISDLFAIRAAGLVQNLSSSTLRSRLSATLLSMEVASVVDIWQGVEVVIIGAGGVGGLYQRALALRAAKVRQLDGGQLVLDGLRAAHAVLGTN